MKVHTLSQSAAEGYFINNRKHTVVEWILPGEDQPLNISSASNKQINKYLTMLKEAEKFKNCSVTDLGYQQFLFENYRSDTKEYGGGFIRFIPKGKESEVMVRVTECDSKTNAKIVARLYRDTRLSRQRTIRRDMPMANNTVKNARLVAVKSDLVVNAGTATNVRVKFA